YLVFAAAAAELYPSSVLHSLAGHDGAGPTSLRTSWTFDGVPAGSYKLHSHHVGALPAIAPRVELVVDRDRDVEVRYEPVDTIVATDRRVGFDTTARFVDRTGEVIELPVLRDDPLTLGVPRGWNGEGLLSSPRFALLPFRVEAPGRLIVEPQRSGGALDVGDDLRMAGYRITALDAEAFRAAWNRRFSSPTLRLAPGSYRVTWTLEGREESRVIEITEGATVIVP
ncbi:MAG: hypothetical protein KDC38_13640, partial [Planctomycetes bacterium]|nr:hypothetical protein [Planctomycetota bacterium]